MYIVLISLGAGLIFYGLGAWMAGWIAGFIPGLLAAGVVGFLLFRKVSGEVRAVMEKAAARLQAPVTTEQAQEQMIEEAKKILLSALIYRRWWFAIPEQVHGQIGQLSYAEAVRLKLQKKLTPYKEKLTEAKTSLALAWSRDWQSNMVLGLVHHREGQVDAAIDAFKKAAPSVSGQPMFWGIYAWVLLEARKRDEALQVLASGLKTSPKDANLIAMQEALSNKRRADMKIWGEPWYNLFPEEIPQEVLMEMARKAGVAPQRPRGPVPQKGPPPMRGGGRPR